MGPDVALEVKGVVEALVAVRAEMPLHLAVAFQVSVQHTLVGEALLAERTGELVPGTLSLRHLQGKGRLGEKPSWRRSRLQLACPLFLSTLSTLQVLFKSRKKQNSNERRKEGCETQAMGIEPLEPQIGHLPDAGHAHLCPTKADRTGI